MITILIMIFEQDRILENDRVLLELHSLHHLESLVSIAVKIPDLLMYSPSKFGTYEIMTDYLNRAIQMSKGF